MPKVMITDDSYFIRKKLSKLLAEHGYDIVMAENGAEAVRIYRKSELIDRLERAGARFLGHHYAHSIHAPYWWLKRFVGPTRTDSAAVNLYHRLLVWDIMKKPWLTRLIDRLFNPLMGKSVVLYLRKEPTL